MMNFMKHMSSASVAAQLPMKANFDTPRLAATVLLLAHSKSDDFDYRILFIERSKKSSFMPSRYVFPGGVIDSSDRNFKVSTNLTTIHVPNSPDCHAVRVGALREVFEETGILLAYEPNGRSPPNITNSSDSRCCKKYPACYEPCQVYHLGISLHELQQLRTSVHSNPNLFSRLLEERNVIPHISTLHPWSRWITPVVESRRYDTLFYIAPLPMHFDPPPASADSLIGEAENTVWYSPSEALHASRTGKILLAPPTAYVLEELSNLRHICDVVRAAPNRSFLPILPQIHIQDEKPLVVLPGDPLYSSEKVNNQHHGLHRVVADHKHGGWKVFAPRINANL